MWIVRLALRRPYTVLMSVLAVLLFGGLSIARLKRDILPNIDIPVVIVVWNYPGLSADDMETRVMYITERALSTTVGGISRIESQSLSSIGIARVYFEEGADIGSAIAQIVEAAARQRSLAEGRYQTGIGNIIELTDALYNDLAARLQLVQAQLELASARARLQHALGEDDS